MRGRYIQELWRVAVLVGLMIVAGCGGETTAAHPWTYGQEDGASGGREDAGSVADGDGHVPGPRPRDILREYVWFRQEFNDMGPREHWFEFESTDAVRAVHWGRDLGDEFFYEMNGHYWIDEAGVVEYTVRRGDRWLGRRRTAAFLSCEDGVATECSDEDLREIAGSSPDWVWSDTGFLAQDDAGTTFRNEHAELHREENQADPWVVRDRVSQTAVFEHPPTSDRPCRMSLEVELEDVGADDERQEETVRFDRLECEVEPRDDEPGYELELPAVQSIAADLRWSAFLDERGLDERLPHDLYDLMQYSSFDGTALLFPDADPAVLVPRTADPALVSAPPSAFPESPPVEGSE